MYTDNKISEGLILYKNGDKYFGKVQNGVRHGEGVMYPKKRNVQGVWKHYQKFIEHIYGPYKFHGVWQNDVQSPLIEKFHFKKLRI